MDLDNTDTLLCPKLEEVKFSNCVNGGLDTMFVQFAESRWPMKQRRIDSTAATAAAIPEASTTASSSTPSPSQLPPQQSSLSQPSDQEPCVARLRSLHIAFGAYGGTTLKNRTGDWVNLKKRISVLVKDGMKLNWMYPGKEEGE
ncbi:hypothetical protein BT96DRAFT_992756 [Gymnopus androsaceus JB14]|uniref:Uncharacterized protein n=1 Tax=Gymnopus androsaceus JB14 TaxID=1447944 RepID=A0A6A4HS95_9AGAR|nr:hypothetical protein BT96DRAFT_992756 [Gymnopus androsaceus JB14]